MLFFIQPIFRKESSIMTTKNTNQQIRKGDPLAKLNTSKGQISSMSNSSIGYKLNTRIRSLRNAKGWSQTELGEKLAEVLGNSSKIPTSTIASWEHKDPALAKIPSPDKIDALAKLFSVSADYLKGLSEDPKRSAMEFIANQSQIQNIEILPQELAQHMGEPIWIQSDSYNGWMLLTELYELVDSKGKIHSVQEIRKLNAVFSVFPPCHVYFRQIYNRYVIPETQIRNYREKMWVCINSPDPKMQELNGWYTRTPDGIGVKGKTLLSFDSYFDFWLAYTTPLSD